MDGKDSESPGPRQKHKSLPGHDIFCTPENSSFLSKTPYKTLDPTRREIRLLRILPDSGSGFVECELLPSAPIAELRGKYWALSYCAGNPRNTEIILVNGVKCNVFANLCHALTCARHFWTTQPGNEDFLLWADQLCINQADLSERSHQVGFMRDIYQSAMETLICLSTQNTQGKGLASLVELYHLQGPRIRFRRWGRPSSPVNELPPRDMAVIWEEIIESPWWSRAWVFQEFMVSADATFLSGYYQMSWAKAWRALEAYIGPKSHPELTFSLKSTFQSRRRPELDDDDDYDDNYDNYVARVAAEAAAKAWFMLQTKAEWEDTAASLVFLLARSRNSKASDDRDRIYAFLGLADPGYAITPDYSASNTTCHVLTETTKNIILFENSLRVLSVLDAPPLARRPGLPSWAVDWTRDGITRSVNTTPIDEMRYTARGEGQAVASFRETTHPETQQVTTIMEVTGVYVKDVEYAKPRFSLPWASEYEVLEVWKLRGSACKFFLRRESYGYRIVRWTNRDGGTTRLKTISKGLGPMVIPDEDLVWSSDTDPALAEDSDWEDSDWEDSDLEWNPGSNPAWAPATESARSETEESRVIAIF
ncbi:hypothetical protein LCI18_004149 [Fusarium solani-melongenae]|uniref:Uncharacterized protein n=1 Tax=Fusarium solani subsp. cucurbitae TaxID=2747967 RepID=A0ACD3YW46_FUSSC|nr:hypothetical protein LCI18_004149 [Fusarium solani-melongenae]